jgi:hypothetical protein
MLVAFTPRMLVAFTPRMLVAALSLAAAGGLRTGMSASWVTLEL